MAFGAQEKAMLEKLEELERQIAAMRLEAMGGEQEEEPAEMEDMVDETAKMPEEEELEEGMEEEMPEEEEEMSELQAYLKDKKMDDGPKRPAGVMIAVGASPKGGPKRAPKGRKGRRY